MNAFCQFLTKPWLYLLVIILGSLLKFYHLNYKLFWRDEISTVLYTSGIKEKDYFDRIPVNEVKNIYFYDSLIHPASNSTSVKAEITQILSDTHLTPAHYVFLTLWYRIAGDEAFHFRLFSVFIFLLTLPFLFLLVRTLLNSSLAGWMASSLYAVSPFINHHAQEARYYVLWVFFFVLSNYLLLLVIKRTKLAWWIAYSLVTVFALYTSLLSSLFIFGQVLYIFLHRKELRTRFAISLLFIVLAYLPWLYFLYTVRTVIESGVSWQVYDHPSIFTLELLFFQLLGWSRSFNYIVDMQYYWVLFNGTLYPALHVGLVIDIILLCLILYAFVYLFRNSSKEIKWFLTLITLPLFLLVYISDSIRNAFLSVIWRYQIINMVTIIIVVANLVKDKISKGRLAFAGIYLGLVILGLGSILKIENKRYWFNADSPSIINVAKTVNRAYRPLIITDFGGLQGYGFVNFLAIINESRSENADIIYCKAAFPAMEQIIRGKSYSDIYIIQSSDELIQNLKSVYGDRMMIHQKEENVWSTLFVWKIKI